MTSPSNASSPGGQARLAEAARRHDHAVEALAVDRPAGGDPADGRVQPDPVGDAEVLRVGAQIGVDLLGGGVKRMVGRGGEVRERGHRAARVRVHSRPHAAVGSSRVPLAAEVIARLEDRHVEARLERMLGGHETARAGAHDRHTCTGSQPHTATLSDRAPLSSRLGASVSKPGWARFRRPRRQVICRGAGALGMLPSHAHAGRLVPQGGAARHTQRTRVRRPQSAIGSRLTPAFGNSPPGAQAPRGAESSTTTCTRSRIERTPTTSSPSTTGRWR